MRDAVAQNDPSLVTSYAKGWCVPAELDKEVESSESVIAMTTRHMEALLVLSKTKNNSPNKDTTNMAAKKNAKKSTKVVKTPPVQHPPESPPDIIVMKPPPNGTHGQAVPTRVSGRTNPPPVADEDEEVEPDDESSTNAPPVVIDPKAKTMITTLTEETPIDENVDAIVKYLHNKRSADIKRAVEITNEKRVESIDTEIAKLEAAIDEKRKARALALGEAVETKTPGKPAKKTRGPSKPRATKAKSASAGEVSDEIAADVKLIIAELAKDGDGHTSGEIAKALRWKIGKPGGEPAKDNDRWNKARTAGVKILGTIRSDGPTRSAKYWRA